MQKLNHQRRHTMTSLAKLEMFYVKKLNNKFEKRLFLEINKWYTRIDSERWCNWRLRGMQSGPISKRAPIFYGPNCPLSSMTSNISHHKMIPQSWQICESQIIVTEHLRQTPSHEQKHWQSYKALPSVLLTSDGSFAFPNKAIDRWDQSCSSSSSRVVRFRGGQQENPKTSWKSTRSFSEKSRSAALTYDTIKKSKVNEKKRWFYLKHRRA